MKLLAIETSTNIASVAVLNHQTFDQTLIEGVKTHAKVLLPEIDKILKRHHLLIQDLDGIVFGRGPGSFTGLRVACAIAKGLALAHNKDVYPVSTLSAIIFEAKKKYSQPILALIDARMNELYWAYDEGQAPVLEQVSDAQAILPEGEAPLVIAGYGFMDYLKDFKQDLLARVSEKILITPQAGTLIQMVHEGLVQKENALTAEPIYIRNDITQGAGRG